MGGEAGRLWRIGLGVRRSPCSRQRRPNSIMQAIREAQQPTFGLSLADFWRTSPTLTTLLADKSIAPVRVR